MTLIFRSFGNRANYATKLVILMTRCYLYLSVEGDDDYDELLAQFEIGDPSVSAPAPFQQIPGMINLSTLISYLFN